MSVPCPETGGGGSRRYMFFMPLILYLVSPFKKYKIVKNIPSLYTAYIYRLGLGEGGRGEEVAQRSEVEAAGADGGFTTPP
jgi:hypothetical protein